MGQEGRGGEREKEVSKRKMLYVFVTFILLSMSPQTMLGNDASLLYKEKSISISG